MTFGIKKGSKVMLIGKKVSEAQTQFYVFCSQMYFSIQCLFDTPAF